MFSPQSARFHGNHRTAQTPSWLIKSYQSKSLSNLNTSNPRREQVEDKLTWRDFCTPRECCFLSFLGAVSGKVSERRKIVSQKERKDEERMAKKCEGNLTYRMFM